MGTRLVDLAAHPEYVEGVARWIDAEWAGFSRRSLDETITRYRDAPGPGRLPVTLVALAGDALAGVASLRDKDSFDWLPDVRHWVCGVYVPPERRGAGIAGRLCRALEDCAGRLGIETLHLATEIGRDSLYHRLGYVEVGRRDHQGMNYLLRKSLAPNGASGSNDHAL